MADRVRQNRIRRVAERQGYEVHKIRRRDPRAWDYDMWTMTATHPERVRKAPPEGPLTLDEVEAFLLGGEPQPKGDR